MGTKFALFFSSATIAGAFSESIHLFYHMDDLTGRQAACWQLQLPIWMELEINQVCRYSNTTQQ